jgi:hypothetical protein
VEQKKKDESRERRREEAIARRMAEALDRLAGRDAGECPEPELIAAYHERGLEPRETARWESHFAACSRCRKVLDVLAATANTPLAEKEVTHLGKLVAAAQAPPAPETAASPQTHRWDWRVRWLAPALGVAAVLAVWFSMRAPWRAPQHSSSETLVAQAPKSESPQRAENPAREQFSRTAPKSSSEVKAESPSDRAISKTPSENAVADAQFKDHAADGKPSGALVPSAGFADLPPQPAARTLPPAAAPSPSTSQSVVATGPSSAIEAGAGPAANTLSADKQPLVGQTAAEAATARSLAGRSVMALSQTNAVSEGVALVRAPSGSILWRAGKNGQIQRSSDAGRTWSPQDSPSQEDWIAGAAASDTVCWLVGRNGAIARTTDGEHWEKIAPPPLAADPAGKLPDWIGVTARDVQVATITAGDQRRYTTRDSGKTWQTQ